MANLSGAYDPNAEASQDFAPIPTGDYLAQIVDSDMKPTRNNDGHYLELVHEIIDGPLAKRKLWHNINLDNPNADAVRIGNEQFASVREATGVPNPIDSHELHYRPVVIRVEFQPADPPDWKPAATGRKKRRDRDQSVIKSWKKPEGASASGNAAAASSAPAAIAASPSDSTPPWKRNRAA
ncbi:MAG: DUF669 domain-containing protein [Pseudoxanthomonas sp.]|nr:DUF669 domain-containing protein [Pseudoxanthomonas sp.]